MEAGDHSLVADTQEWCHPCYNSSQMKSSPAIYHAPTHQLFGSDKWVLWSHQQSVFFLIWPCSATSCPRLSICLSEMNCPLHPAQVITENPEPQLITRLQHLQTSDCLNSLKKMHRSQVKKRNIRECVPQMLNKGCSIIYSLCNKVKKLTEGINL